MQFNSIHASVHEIGPISWAHLTGIISIHHCHPLSFSAALFFIFFYCSLLFVFPLLCSLHLFLALSFFPCSSHCPDLPLCCPGNGPIEKACCLGNTSEAAYTRRRDGGREVQAIYLWLHWRCDPHLFPRQILLLEYQHVAHCATMLFKKHANYSTIYYSVPLSRKANSGWWLSSCMSHFSSDLNLAYYV